MATLQPTNLGQVGNTGVYRVSLQQSGLSSVGKIVIHDDNLISGGTGGASGIDIDFVKLAQTFTASSSSASTLPSLIGGQLDPGHVKLEQGFMQPWSSGDNSAWNTSSLFGTSGFNVINFGESSLDVRDGQNSAAGGALSLGEGGQVTITLNSPIPTQNLYLYVGDAGGGNDSFYVDVFPDTTFSPRSGVTLKGTSGDDNLILGKGGVGLNVNLGSGDDTVDGSGGADTISTGPGNDRIIGGPGNDRLDGGDGVDTAVYSLNRTAYTITHTGLSATVSGGLDGTDTLTNVERLQFSDQLMKLPRGTGAAIAVGSADPATFMNNIKDFSGNDLGGASGWKLIGATDIQRDGDAEHIFVNSQISRWATVGTSSDGLVYMNDYSWGGDTRVVGIYIDPLIQAGLAASGGPFDSQVRFTFDLSIGNIGGVLGSGDYDHNGLQEVYFSLTDKSAYLHAYMHADGNIQYANYQSQQQVTDYMNANGVPSAEYSGWFVH